MAATAGPPVPFAMTRTRASEHSTCGYTFFAN